MPPLSRFVESWVGIPQLVYMVYPIHIAVAHWDCRVWGHRNLWTVLLVLQDLPGSDSWVCSGDDSDDLLVTPFDSSVKLSFCMTSRLPSLFRPFSLKVTGGLIRFPFDLTVPWAWIFESGRRVWRVLEKNRNCQSSQCDACQRWPWSCPSPLEHQVLSHRCFQTSRYKSKSHWCIHSQVLLWPKLSVHI